MGWECKYNWENTPQNKKKHLPQPQAYASEGILKAYAMRLEQVQNVDG